MVTVTVGGTDLSYQKAAGEHFRSVRVPGLRLKVPEFEKLPYNREQVATQEASAIAKNRKGLSM